MLTPERRDFFDAETYRVLFLQSRINVRSGKRTHRPVGDDPKLPDVWLRPRPDRAGYADALAAWRAQSTNPEPADDKESGS
jgi:hypothetical protein